MKFSTRIWIIILAALTGMLLLASLAVYTQREAMLDGRKQQLDLLVNLAYAAVEKVHQREMNGELTREAAQQEAKAILSSYQRDDNYYFVRDFTSDVLLVHPNAQRIGAPPSAEAVQKGDEYRNAIGQAKTDVAFVASRDGTRPGVSGKVAKLYGVKKFESWNWMIGFGEYIDDIENDFWRSALFFLSIAGALLVPLMALALRMRGTILRQLGGEPADVADSMRKIASGDLAIDIKLASNDNSSLMASLKMMQMKLKNLTSAIHENASNLSEQALKFEASAKSYTDTRSDADLFELVRGLKKLGKTSDILLKSVSRFKS
ncbi:cache domain-containing protein [Jeongeupia wiesaeckerbachi]|uniref:cache domain-containing protein n=1 Tax=Jeongeupia wiesaeckerbachi TaxID=3051218 RepID=UPI003D8013A4